MDQQTSQQEKPMMRVEVDYEQTLHGFKFKDTLFMRVPVGESFREQMEKELPEGAKVLVVATMPDDYYERLDHIDAEPR